MKVKNLSLKGLSIVHGQGQVTFDMDGLSEDLSQGAANVLAALPGFSLVEEKKPTRTTRKKEEPTKKEDQAKKTSE